MHKKCNFYHVDGSVEDFVLRMNLGQVVNENETLRSNKINM